MSGRLAVAALLLAGCGGGDSRGAPGGGSGDTGAGGGGGDPAGAGGTTAGAGGASATPRCSGRPGALKGATDHAGFDAGAGGPGRHFILYEPAALDPNVPAPVVVVPHGDTESAQHMFDVTGYPAKADAEGFVVAFPTGETGDMGPLLPGPWNVGSGVCGFGSFAGNSGDDQAFLDAILAFIDTDQCVDRDHVFISGFSMGGYLSNETGCLNPRFHGIGPASGGTHDLSACPGNQPMPAILFHGTADPVIAATCGQGARDGWAQRNGCAATFTSEPVTGGHCEYSDACPPGGQVALCLFDGMGHAWPGENGDPAQASGSDLGWEFFKTQAW